jgi:hydroxylamine reductase
MFTCKLISVNHLLTLTSQNDWRIIMANMFCFQCQQTAGNKGCINTGVCGKQPETAHLQDELVYELIRLATAAHDAHKHSKLTDRLLIDGLFTTLTNVNFDDEAIRTFTDRVRKERCKLTGDDISLVSLWDGANDIVSLRSTLLFGMKGMAAYAHHAMNLGYMDDTVIKWFYKGLCEINKEHTPEEWIDLIMEFGQVNFKCMELLDRANTETFGTPEPTRVLTDIKKGPFIVVSGHDLKDISQLLEQTKDKGINIYTHSEMLPAHGYPELKKYPHLAGNFGTAWQSQQKEFDNIPAPILFTTNCLMPQRPSYQDRVYTTSVVGYKGLTHITGDADGNKDFTPIIEHALRLGGYEHDHSMSGINGGHVLTTGFAHAAVLSHAEQIISSIRQGHIRHIFLVGGCDGAHPGRNYYTDFVKQTPMDSLVLTLACGKYRFNDLDLGEIDGIPRILDMGQCNDSYSAIKVALALADAFDCSVNDLPLTLVLSWYEQKAVCILLTLLSLGIRNMYLGPTLPAFMSETVVKYLVDTYNLQPITAPEQDMDAILKRG